MKIILPGPRVSACMVDVLYARRNDFNVATSKSSRPVRVPDNIVCHL